MHESCFKKCMQRHKKVQEYLIMLILNLKAAECMDLKVRMAQVKPCLCGL